MKEYQIRKRTRKNENYSTMVIINRETGDEIAEYRLTPGGEKKEISQMRREIDRHLDNNGTLGNYQW